MNAHSLLSELTARGAVVSVSGDRLRLQAVDGVVWDDLRPTIQTLKPELLQLLDLETRSREYSEPCHTVPPLRSDLLHEITGTAAPCVSCGVFCGELALCAFCCREANA
jgi:hypothetical protein